jgi:hypothetical protein
LRVETMYIPSMAIAEMRRLMEGSIRMKRYGLLLLSVVAMLALLPGTAGASNFAVDQSNTGHDNFDQGPDNYAQTFTAGRYGPLEYIELYLGNASTSVNVGVALWSTTGTASTAIPHASIDATSKTVTTEAGEWVQFNFDNDILIPGRVYAIVIIPTSDAAVFGSTANAYTRGRALAFDGGSWKPERTVVPFGPLDWSFKTEMGAAAATPTPTHIPTHAPTRTPTPTLTSTPMATTTAVAPVSVAPSDSAASTSVVAGASGSGSGSAAGSDSSGSGDSMLPILAAIVVILLLVGVIGYLLVQLRRSRAGNAGGGPSRP